MSKRTAIYVSLRDETASDCFDVLTHDGDPETLEPGVSLSLNFGASGVAVVETKRASGLMGLMNHTPGCQVTKYETH
ncbi:MAG: hypothetical protein ACRDHW_07135 [Ktedonobacteraceae bacterium]